MKKTYLFIAMASVFALCLPFTGCKNNNAETTTNTPATTTENQVSQDEAEKMHNTYVPQEDDHILQGVIVSISDNKDSIELDVDGETTVINIEEDTVLINKPTSVFELSDRYLEINDFFSKNGEKKAENEDNSRLFTLGRVVYVKQNEDGTASIIAVANSYSGDYIFDDYSDMKDNTPQDTELPSDNG